MPKHKELSVLQRPQVFRSTLMKKLQELESLTDQEEARKDKLTNDATYELFTNLNKTDFKMHVNPIANSLQT